MKVLTAIDSTRKVCCAYPRCENPSEQIEVPESMFDGDKISAEYRNMYHNSFYVTAWGEVCCCYDCYREVSLF
jgi:hypothetical protein